MCIASPFFQQPELEGTINLTSNWMVSLDSGTIY